MRASDERIVAVILLPVVGSSGDDLKTASPERTGLLRHGQAGSRTGLAGRHFYRLKSFTPVNV
jgi:hypothetical protein